MHYLPFYLFTDQLEHDRSMGMAAEYYPVGCIQKDRQGPVRIAPVYRFIQGIQIFGGHDVDKAQVPDYSFSAQVRQVIDYFGIGAFP
jgi:hypothetical protein